MNKEEFDFTQIIQANGAGREDLVREAGNSRPQRCQHLAKEAT